MIEIRLYLIPLLLAFIIGSCPESDFAVGSEHYNRNIKPSISEDSQEITLIETLIASDSTYLRQFVNSMIRKDVGTIAITGIDNFEPMVVFVRGHKFYFVTSEIPEYQLNIHFEGSDTGFFEFGNHRYAVYGNFEQVEAQWKLSNLSPMNMD